MSVATEQFLQSRNEVFLEYVANNTVYDLKNTKLIVDQSKQLPTSGKNIGTINFSFYKYFDLQKIFENKNIGISNLKLQSLEDSTNLPDCITLSCCGSNIINTFDIELNKPLDFFSQENSILPCCGEIFFSSTKNTDNGDNEVLNNSNLTISADVYELNAECFNTEYTVLCRDKVLFTSNESDSTNNFLYLMPRKFLYFSIKDARFQFVDNDPNTIHSITLISYLYDKTQIKFPIVSNASNIWPININTICDAFNEKKVAFNSLEIVSDTKQNFFVCIDYFNTMTFSDGKMVLLYAN